MTRKVSGIAPTDLVDGRDQLAWLSTRLVCVYLAVVTRVLAEADLQRPGE